MTAVTSKARALVRIIKNTHDGELCAGRTDNSNWLYRRLKDPLGGRMKRTDFIDLVGEVGASGKLLIDRDGEGRILCIRLPEIKQCKQNAEGDSSMSVVHVDEGRKLPYRVPTTAEGVVIGRRLTDDQVGELTVRKIVTPELLTAGKLALEVLGTDAINEAEAMAAIEKCCTEFGLLDSLNPTTAARHVLKALCAEPDESLGSPWLERLEHEGAVQYRQTLPSEPPSVQDRRFWDLLIRRMEDDGATITELRSQLEAARQPVCAHGNLPELLVEVTDRATELNKKAAGLASENESLQKQLKDQHAESEQRLATLQAENSRLKEELAQRPVASQVPEDVMAKIQALGIKTP